MWAYESVFYQIYPLGFCGAPFENDGVLTHRIQKVNDWIPHIQKLGANAVYFSPLDRKSTRLNSSHQIISYAVFCLKKFSSKWRLSS